MELLMSIYTIFLRFLPTPFRALAMFSVLTLLVSCGSEESTELYNQWKNGGNFSKVSNIYPEDQSIIPPELAPPAITWEDSTKKCSTWNVIIECGGTIIANSGLIQTATWIPDAAVWEEVKTATIEKEAKIIILGADSASPATLLAGSEVRFKTSKDSVGAPIFFRTVPLPFKFAVENLDRISWRLGTVSGTKPAPIVLDRMVVCANCHSFSKDGKVMGLDVDYANDKGSYAVDYIAADVKLTPDKIITWSDYHREDGRKTYGLLSSVSPDGRYVASTVKDRSIFVSVDDEYYSQLFFPIKGIIAVYDRQKKLFSVLSGADDPAFVQSNPVWSPDGKSLLFCKTTAFTSPEAEKSSKAILPTYVAKEFIERSRRFYYDIYTIPFNDGKGGVPLKLPGASGNNKSNYFPRYSPDGKWIVFNQAENFMLLQGDSKLYIMPATGGKPRLMNCNTRRMNSWHSFSPNGKWLVFSSKQRGPYTKLFITHIDENGNDSPPLCLEYLTPDTLAANIPEFVNMKPDAGFKISEHFLNSGFYTESVVSSKARSGDFPGALKDLDAAIKSDPKNYMLYLQRSIIEDKLGSAKKAMDDVNKCLALNKDCADAYSHRAKMKNDAEDFKGAVEDLNLVLKHQPRNFMALYYIAYTWHNQQDYNKSTEVCNKVIAMKPDYSYSYFLRALNNIKQNRMNSVCEDLHKAYSLGCPEARQVINDYCGGM